MAIGRSRGESTIKRAANRKRSVWHLRAFPGWNAALPNASQRRTGRVRFRTRANETPGLTYYLPAWKSDPDVEFDLDSLRTPLTRAGNRYYELSSGLPYNPASGLLQGDDYVLTDPQGIVFAIESRRGIVEVRDDTGDTLAFVRDSGVLTTDGTQVKFVHDSNGRLIRIDNGSDIVHYQYDSAGNLADVLADGTSGSTLYGYDHSTANRLSVLVDDGSAIAVNYSDITYASDIVSHLGDVQSFAGSEFNGQVANVDPELFSLRLHQEEIDSTLAGRLLLRVEVDSNGNFQPAAPTIRGLDPISTEVNGSRIVSMFLVETEGLFVVEVSGTDDQNVGQFDLRVSAAGDVNSDGKVDGVDSQLIDPLVGLTSSDPEFNADYDLNGDASIDVNDQLVVVHNFGFFAITAPSMPVPPHTGADAQRAVGYGCQ